MAEQPSSNNPFLGKQSPTIPEKPAQSTESNTAPLSPSSAQSDVSASSGSVPENFIPTPTSKRWQKIIRRSLTVLVLILLIAGVVYWWFQTAPEPVVEEEPTVSVTETRPTLPPTVIEEVLPLEGNANYESENFKAGEIVIGGELQFLMAEAEVGPLVIENIRGEAFTEKSKQEVKLVVTWTTNKLAQAAVRYSKGVGQSERSVEEDDYSYNHSVIVSGLDPASTYLYTIDAVDRYGNRAKSEPYAVFTGARTVSLFDLIAGAIGEVFGWAVTNK